MFTLRYESEYTKFEMGQFDNVEDCQTFCHEHFGRAVTFAHDDKGVLSANLWGDTSVMLTLAEERSA